MAENWIFYQVLFACYHYGALKPFIFWVKWSSLKLRLLRFLIKPKTHVFLTNIYLESYLNIVSTCRSIKSWDSHTHYQEFKEPDDDPVFFPSRPMQSIVCYCDMATLKTPRTILRVLLVVSCYSQRFLKFASTSGRILLRFSIGILSGLTIVKRFI